MSYHHLYHILYLPLLVLVALYTANGGATDNGKTSTRASTQTMNACLQSINIKWSMSFLDLILLHSNFTKREVITAFLTLTAMQIQQQQRKTSSICEIMQVLYPVVNLKGFISPNFQHKQRLIETHTNSNITNHK